MNNNNILYGNFNTHKYIKSLMQQYVCNDLVYCTLFRIMMYIVTHIAKLFSVFCLVFVISIYLKCENE